MARLSSAAFQLLLLSSAALAERVFFAALPGRPLSPGEAAAEGAARVILSDGWSGVSPVSPGSAPATPVFPAGDARIRPGLPGVHAAFDHPRWSLAGQSAILAGVAAAAAVAVALAAHPRATPATPALPARGRRPRGRAPLPRMIATPTKPATTTEAFDKVVMKTYGRFSLTVSHGKGCYLFDTEGKKYLDFAAGISTCCLGHADVGLVDAVTKQMKQVHHVSNLYYIPQQGELAQRLVDSCCADRAFFCNSGAEANEAAIKLARKHASTVLDATEPVIITALNSFHGRTLATITATGQPKYQAGFGPLVQGFEYVPYNDVDALRALVKKINGGGPLKRGRKLAAILLEPLQGEGGITPATREFYAAARELCDETGALLMADEVQTGMGRTGEMWGYMNHGVEVDVLTTAKALGGGVPIGAMLCKERANVFLPGDHASTYGGNPLACAAGNAVLDAFDKRGILENVRARGAQLRSGLEAIAADTGVIQEVRGWGLIMGVELSEASGILASDVVAKLMTAGMLTVPAGPRVVRFVPPLVVSESEVKEALEKVQKVLKELV